MKRVRVRFEIGFEPVARFQIEVVGGLVEKQQIRLFKQEFGERDTHLPAAGELFHAALPVLTAETQARQNGAHAGFNVVAIAGGKFGLNVVVALDDLLVLGAGVVDLAHALLERLLLGFKGADLVENRQAFVEDAASREGDAILRQVARADAFHGR